MRSSASTPSWQARLIAALLSNRRLPSSCDLRTLRALLEFRLFHYDGCAIIQPGNAGGVRGEWVEAAGGSEGVLLYLHGGGYFSCSACSHRGITTGFAARGLRVFAVDYRLAPENPFPAGLDDAVAAYRAIRAELGPDAAIAIAGDSAGGGLALATMLRLRDEGHDLPVAAVLFSPLADLSAEGPARVARWTIPDALALAAVRQWYVGDHDPRDPLASPIYGDFTGLPPILIHVSEDETLLDDALRLAERSAGTFTIVRWPLVPHVWQLSPRVFPEARQSLDLASEFLIEKMRETGIASPQERAS